MKKAETNIEREKKKTIKQKNRAQKRGSQKERLSLEAKIEAETIEQEDETVSETVE